MNGNISREVPIHYTIITDKLITDNLQTKYKKLQRSVNNYTHYKLLQSNDINSK